MRFQNGEFWPIQEPSASFTGRLASLFDQRVIPRDFWQRFNRLGQGIETDGVSSMPFLKNDKTSRGSSRDDCLERMKLEARISCD